MDTFAPPFILATYLTLFLLVISAIKPNVTLKITHQVSVFVHLLPIQVNRYQLEEMRAMSGTE